MEEEESATGRNVLRSSPTLSKYFTRSWAHTNTRQ